MYEQVNNPTGAARICLKSSLRLPRNKLLQHKCCARHDQNEKSCLGLAEFSTPNNSRTSRPGRTSHASTGNDHADGHADRDGKPLPGARRRRRYGIGKECVSARCRNQPGAQNTGTAFCVDKTGLFVTSADVVKELQGPVGGDVHLVLDLARNQPRSVQARLHRMDEELGLALLKIEPHPSLEPLELLRDADLTEMMSVTTVGFPWGRWSSLNQNPEMTVVSGRVTSWLRVEGKATIVQLDNQLDAGNSGGAVLDSRGARRRRSRSREIGNDSIRDRSRPLGRVPPGTGIGLRTAVDSI